MSYVGDLAIYRLNVGGHFYTTDCHEAQTLILGTSGCYVGVECYVASAAAMGLVPIYRFVRGATHFYTADDSEKDAVVAEGWLFEAVMGYVSTVPTSDTVPLYRAFQRVNGNHLYTTSQIEWSNAIATGWASEGITGHVSANQTLKCTAIQQALQIKKKPLRKFGGW